MPFGIPVTTRAFASFSRPVVMVIPPLIAIKVRRTECQLAKLHVTHLFLQDFPDGPVAGATRSGRFIAIYQPVKVD